MAKNIEIKARLDDIDFCLEKARELSDEDPIVIEQEDFFFNCKKGRLKLRVLSKQKGELIFYRRENTTGPKTSEYFISKTDEPEKLLQVLEMSYGILGIVKKTRKLFLIGKTRVHIDKVHDLGDFLEFEVVLKEDDSPQTAGAEAKRLIKQFRIEEHSLVQGAYVDLLKTNL